MSINVALEILRTLPDASAEVLTAALDLAAADARCRLLLPEDFQDGDC